MKTWVTYHPDSGYGLSNEDPRVKAVGPLPYDVVEVTLKSSRVKYLFATLFKYDRAQAFLAEVFKHEKEHPNSGRRYG